MVLGGRQILDAMQVREAARRFFPVCGTCSLRQALRLRRRWVRAWRRAEGAKVPIGPPVPRHFPE